MSEIKIIRVSDVMTDNYHLVDGMLMINEALDIMKAYGRRVLLVEKRHDDDEYGIVLLTDIAHKVLAVDRAAERINVYEVMTKPVVGVDPDMDIRYCARLFCNFGFSYAPVLDCGELKGIVGFAELLLNDLYRNI
jgi:predicted transcriptional regulator